MSNHSPSTIIKATLIILAIIAGFLVVYYFLHEILLVFMGVVLSISIAPAVDFLHQHKVHRSLSVILIYLVALLLLAGFIFLVIPQIAQQITNIAPKMSGLYSSFRSAVLASPYSFIRGLMNGLPPDLNTIFNVKPVAPGKNPMDSINLTLQVVQSVLSFLFKISIILLIGFYWTLEQERVKYAFSLLFPVDKRDEIRATIDDIENRVGGFVRGQGLLALAIGVMVLIAYSIIGLPSVVSLAIIAAICELIPVFGPTLGAIPAVLIAFAVDPVKVYWVIPVTIFLQFIENHFLSPQVMNRVVKVNPIVTILSITAFGYFLGFSGFIMAIPLAAIFQVILDRSVLNPQVEEVKEPVGRDSLSKLHLDTQEFVQDVRKLVRRKETDSPEAARDEVEDAIESIASELDDLIVQSLPPEEEKL